MVLIVSIIVIANLWLAVEAYIRAADLAKSELVDDAMYYT